MSRSAVSFFGTSHPVSWRRVGVGAGMGATSVAALAVPHALQKEPSLRTSRVRPGVTRVFRKLSCSSSNASSSSTSSTSIDALPGVDSHTGTQRSLFCFGLGYTSLGLVSTLRKEGWHVAGTCRTEDRASALREAGIDAHRWCPDDDTFLNDAGANALQNATHVLVSVPPMVESVPPGGHTTLRSNAQKVNESIDSVVDSNGTTKRETRLVDPVLADPLCSKILTDRQKSISLVWLGYLSTTGVYGDHLGGWVDESTEAKPVTAKTKLRYQAESDWLSFAEKSKCKSLKIFRLGGVYGPTRSLLDSVQLNYMGKQCVENIKTQSASKRNRATRRFIARCHVHDVVAVLCASMSIMCSDDDDNSDDASKNVKANTEPRVYNVVDDDPGSRVEALLFAERLLSEDKTDLEDKSDKGGELSTQSVQTKTSGLEKNAFRGEKRVVNALVKTSLCVELTFPSYRKGLSAIHKGETTPFAEDILDIL